MRPFKDGQNRQDGELQIRYQQTLSNIDQLRVDISALQAKAEQEATVLG